MEELLQTLLIALPPLLAQGVITVALLVAGVWIYILLTPFDDMKLVRENNIAAAISLFSIIVGLAIPLAFCLAASSSLWEILILGVITVVVQLFAFKVCDWFLRDLSARIERGEVSASIVLLSVKLATAFINSAM